MKNQSIYITMLVFMALSCNDLQTTQKKIRFEVNPESIVANGEELAHVTISFDNLIEENQEVTVYTTQGALYESPTSVLNTGGTKELTFKPGLRGSRKEAIVFLKSDQTPSTEVFVSVEINRLFEQKQIMFTSEPITSIQINPSVFSLDLSSGAIVTLTTILLSANGSPSITGQLEQSITYTDQDGMSISETLLDFTPVIKITNDTLTTTLVPRVTLFSDPAITEAFASITITDPVSGASDSEAIRIF